MTTKAELQKILKEILNTEEEDDTTMEIWGRINLTR
jgi:hypothetical protein